MLSWLIVIWSWFFSPTPTPELQVYNAPGATVGVAWGNGTGGDVSDYEPFFRWLNSQGIVVIAATTPNAGSGDEIVKAAQALRAMGVTRVVAMGHSQGAGGALRASAKSDLFDAVVPIQPGTVFPDRNDISDFPVVPAFFVTGSLDRLSVATDVQERLAEPYPGPVVHGTRRGIGHFAPTGDAGEVRQYVAWFILDDLKFNGIFSDSKWIIH